MLKIIRKNFTIQQCYSACETIRKQGIQVTAFFMLGFPEETESTLKDTVTAMKKLNCNRICYSMFTPYPGTEAFEFCKENGLISDNYDVSLYNHQSPANCFCLNITPERFRVLASKVEKMVDRKNSLEGIRQLFRSANLRKIKTLGVRKSLQKGIRKLRGRK